VETKKDLLADVFNNSTGVGKAFTLFGPIDDSEMEVEKTRKLMELEYQVVMKRSYEI